MQKGKNMNLSIKKNIECLGQILLKIIGMCAVVCAIILALGFSSNGNLEGMKDELKFVSWYAEVYILLVFNISFFTSYLPVLLSFNTTRKELFRAKLLLNSLIIIVSSLVNIWVLSINNKLHTTNILLAISMYLIVSAISNIMGVLMAKFGKKGYIVFICLCGVCGGLGASFSSFIFSIVKNNMFVYITTAVCLVLFIVASFSEHRAINKYEVK